MGRLGDGLLDCFLSCLCHHQGHTRPERDLCSRSPEPLPTDRRPLTPPSNTHPETNAQIQSLLFQKLTLDIRLLIYTEVLAPAGDHLLHVSSTDRRLCSRRCTDHRENRRGWQHSCWPSDTAAYDGIIPHPEPVSGLLRSCRRIYTEAIDILYMRNVIHVRQTRPISEFPLAMTPLRLALIRSLHLDTRLQFDWNVAMDVDVEFWPDQWPVDVISYWEAACQVIQAQMPGLRTFRVSLGVSGAHMEDPAGYWYIARDTFTKLLRYLLPIQHVAEYVVVFHWRADVERIWEDLGVAERDLPFRIEVHDFGDQSTYPG